MVANPELWDALLPVVDMLEALDITYCIGGSVASSFAGVARATLDVDLVADLHPEHAAPLADELTRDYYLDVDMMREAISRHRTFNVIHLATIWEVRYRTGSGMTFKGSSGSRLTVLTLLICSGGPMYLDCPIYCGGPWKRQVCQTHSQGYRATTVLKQGLMERSIHRL